jgi:hypothetical protein
MAEAERRSYIEKRVAEFTPAEKAEFDATGRELADLFDRIGFNPVTQEFRDPVGFPQWPSRQAWGFSSISMSGSMPWFSMLQVPTSGSYKPKFGR